MNISKLLDELKIDEGFSGSVYTCTAGALTIGYGHNLDAKPISKNVASFILEGDVNDCISECSSLDWFHLLSDNRQRAIVNMVFNLGMNGVLKFKNMIAAIESKDFDRAAYEMINSKWYIQVGSRAVRLADMMREG